MAEFDPEQEEALRRLRAAFGFVEVLRIIDHGQGVDPDLDQYDELPEEAVCPTRSKGRGTSGRIPRSDSPSPPRAGRGREG